MTQAARIRRPLAITIGVAVIAVPILISLGTESSQATQGRFVFSPPPGRPALSGAADPRLLRGATGAEPAADAQSLGVAAAARASDDVQANGDNKRSSSQRVGNGKGLPQNETSIAVNPTDPLNVIGSANDYEPGVDGVMGVYTSFDGGKTFPYSRHTRQVITPDRRMLGSGDPVIAFDSAGTAYASFISFGRADCDSYVAVSRSTDKGVTWSVPVDGESEGTGLVVGDGVAAHNAGPADCRIFHDKEWMTAGARPAGVPLVRGTDRANLSPDRLYLTWSRFDFGPSADTYLDSAIYAAYSDDQGRHWSTPQEVSGRSAALCSFQTGDRDSNACDEDQFSVPVVDPRTGTVYVAFQNFNVETAVVNRSQYLVVRSTDGGRTWGQPAFAASVFDGPNKYPVCAERQTLDRMCARVNAAGNIDIDPRNGTLYLTWADNRNGTAADTNTDVFIRMSTDGGRTWIDRANLTAGSRDDQFFPWLSVAPNGTVAVAYFDRRYTSPKLIDTSLSVSTDGATTFSTRRVSEVSWNPDLAFRLGVFIGDYNGLDTTADTAFPMWTDARFAEPNVTGNNPPHQQSDVMVDPEPLR